MPKAKRDPAAPKKNLSSYMYYSQERRPILKEQHPDWPFGEYAKVIGAEWRDMQQEQKKPFEQKAEEDKKRYEKELKAYSSKQAKVAPKQNAKENQKTTQMNGKTQSKTKKTSTGTSKQKGESSRDEVANNKGTKAQKNDEKEANAPQQPMAQGMQAVPPYMYPVQQYYDYYQAPPQYQQPHAYFNSEDCVIFNHQIHNWKTWAKVRKGEWGLVYVAEGPLQGNFMYYDSDQGAQAMVTSCQIPNQQYAVKVTELRKPPVQPFTPVQQPMMSH